MKKQFIAGLALLGALPVLQASIFYQGTAVSRGTDLGAVANATIVDGNPASITVNSMTLSGVDVSLANITVSLNISGGMNNGLYGYLIAPNGATVTLLNQPGYAVNGFGATGAGMNLTLSDAGGANIQNETSGSILSGTFVAYGSLATFNGANPNGIWSLYFSDTVAGGGDATLNGWSLDITAVPEPVNVALGVFCGLVAITVAGRKFLARRPADASRVN